MNILSLFDGISCAKLALDRLGIKCNYYASETGKYAIAVSKYRHPDIIHLGDVSKISRKDLPVIDLLIGGSPCQGFSIAGKKLNFNDDRSKLFFEYVRLKRELRPRWFLLENVKMKKEWQHIISSELGYYAPVEINSDRFVCQNRPRLYWTNFKINNLPDRPEWNVQYYQWRRTYFRENKSGVCPTLTANMGTGGHNVPLKSKDLKDKLSPEECEKLQGIKSGYTLVPWQKRMMSNTQRYKMIGNAFTVDVIKHILLKLRPSDI